MKLALIAGLVCFTGIEVSAQVGVRNAQDQNVALSEYLDVDYESLPPFVKEFLYKAYEVKPGDVSKIKSYTDGEFIIVMNRSFNTFVIDKPLKLSHEKLENINVKGSPRMQNSRDVQPQAKKRTKRTVGISKIEKEIDFMDVPLNIREYLIKEMEADENQVHRIIALGGDKYKITLKKSHNQFKITKDRPDRISLNL